MDTSAPTRGRHVVFGIYGAAVVIAGLFGYALGYVLQPNIDGHAGSLGPVTFALTPLNLAVYGMVMVGLMLGVLLLLVSYVARFDDATPTTVEER
ncbi:DUF7520 family protein [Halarchaeum sp. P4]|uniref:DUF7520 family protein n=1 Tax=Halarchaeum sp. P4 TaxID=3421639 RepID=UPI003EBB6C52